MQNEKSDILVIDDMPDNLRLLDSILRKHYKTRLAPGGDLGLKAAFATPPDLILLDVMMPEMNGYEVIAQLKADQRTADIPVIFISALNDAESKVRGFDAGGVDYISKPFQEKEVLARVSSHLSLRALFLQAQTEIAERKKAEDALRQSEERYQNFIAHTSDGIFRAEFIQPIDISLPIEAQIDLIYKNAYMAECNDALAQMYGMPSAQSLLDARFSAEQGFENRLINRDVLKKFIENGYQSISHEGFESDRSRKPTWFLSNAIGLVENGFLVRLWVTVLDISERKRVEEHVRKLSRAVEASPTSIVITDIEGNIEYVNPKFVEMTGYQVHEAIGKNPRFLKSGQTPSETYTELWDTITKGKEWRGELSNRKKNGEVYWESASISPILDENGTVTHYVAVNENITRRKQMEEREKEQRVLAEALRSTAESLNDSLLLDDILNKISNEVAKVVPFDAMDITWLENGEFTVLRYGVYTSGQEEETKNSELEFLGKDFPAFAHEMTTHQPLIVSDIKTSTIWASSPEAEWVRSHVKAPIVSAGKVVGQLNLYNKNPGFYTPTHAKNLQAFANQVSIAIQNSQLYADVQNLATLDELTGLYNRRGFFEMCRREIGRSQRFGHAFSALFADIDHFKQFNDRYSYETGDDVLHLVAQTLLRNVREIDVVGRYGGEEMIVLLPEHNQPDAVEVAERLRKAIEDLRIPYGNQNLSVTVSIGVATVPYLPERTANTSFERYEYMIDDIIAKAGEAVHIAKQRGRNRVVVYTEITS